VVIRGPQVTLGYWNKPEENLVLFTHDGFLRTGDIGRFDEQGFLYLLDRKKDLIVVSGFNVYPNEVEAVAVQLEGIKEAAAVGIPDPRSGEVVRLFVIASNPDITEAAVIEHCRKHLTRYKVPRRVEFRHDLPRSNVGKVLRRILRDEVLKGQHH
jgi:long-chain acyl-CoA synthetase